jgi:MerR family transcriptional regulator, light-induced transcriptional regulator
MAGLTQHVVTTGRWEDTGERGSRRKPHAGNGGAVRHDGAEQRLLGLARTIEAEVVPRLVLARGASLDQASRATGRIAPHADDILELAELSRGRDENAASAYVGAVRARGVPVDALYLDLLAPAARHLGKLWEQDLCDFMEVTLGLWRLQRVLCDLSPVFHSSERALRPDGLRALLVPVYGEQHTFGLYMVAEFFRRAGWDVSSGPLATRDELVRTVRDRWFTLVGISVGSEQQLESVAASIRAIRRRSRNRAIGVMVGGPVFVGQPDLAARIGADATAIDGLQATLQAQNLLTLLARHR